MRGLAGSRKLPAFYKAISKIFPVLSSVHASHNGNEGGDANTLSCFPSPDNVLQDKNDVHVVVRLGVMTMQFC